MRVVVTRPARGAQRWVALLQARGHQAQALPLIEIQPVADTGPLRQCWRRLEGFQAVMFVSANAVSAFFESNRPLAPALSAWPATKTRAWATGPGTTQALLEAGVPSTQVDAPAPDAPQFDSEALWQRVAGHLQPGGRVLIVRGAGADGEAAGRDWLAAQLQQAGLAVEMVVAYQRAVPQWTFAERERAQQAATDGSVWLFSSSEAVANLGTLLPDQNWAQARAVATHERIAQAARDAGFGVVCPSRPGLDAIHAALESIG